MTETTVKKWLGVDYKGLIIRAKDQIFPISKKNNTVLCLNGLNHQGHSFTHQPSPHTSPPLPTADDPPLTTGQSSDSASASLARSLFLIQFICLLQPAKDSQYRKTISTAPETWHQHGKPRSSYSAVFWGFSFLCVIFVAVLLSLFSTTHQSWFPSIKGTSC